MCVWAGGGVGGLVGGEICIHVDFHILDFLKYAFSKINGKRTLRVYPRAWHFTMVDAVVT